MCGRITILTLDEVREVVRCIESHRGVSANSSVGRNPADPDPDRNDADFLVQTHHGEPMGLYTPNEQPDWDINLNGHAARAQARPGSQLHLIGQDDAGLSIYQKTWGIEAPWNGKPVYNTRIESALGGSGMWARPISEGRCILPAATFFEPHATETTRSPKTGRPIKQNYEFAMPDGTPLLLASVRDGDRFSIVTTEPNATVSPVHPRMPLALGFEEVPLWLEGSLKDIAHLADRSQLPLLSAREAIVPPPANNRASKPRPDERQMSLF